MLLYHFLPAKYALLALERQRLKVARINDLNDPFELFCADMRDAKARRGFREFKDQISAKFGFLCFCRRWQNLLLWSHYADRHRGAALEVEIGDDVAMPVNYTNARVQWNAQEIMSSGGFSLEHVDVITTTKSDHWAYEQEVRAAVPLEGDQAEDGLYFSPVPIKGIVIGACSNISAARIRTALPRGGSVKVTHARLAFKSFNVVRRKDIPVATIRRSR